MSLQLQYLATSYRDRDHCSPHFVVHNNQNGSSEAQLKIAKFVRLLLPLPGKVLRMLDSNPALIARR